jgi:hypothetical protein
VIVIPERAARAANPESRLRSIGSPAITHFTVIDRLDRAIQ